ncbi:hypothetical protein DSC91_000897 [Paraburkholderia caffeinilytica]|uniref:Putative tail fiber protein gp53-like C-terminal domain-containing protein n=1 Tax=Paraburkholderia caffeinilytica TaxID=1761016 RepID=A0ABQ1N865_9BURK|nr:hypothetical protein [Paraburkholderia caffeinilytica]AXL49180.1 hypothetical protein DSC91_000897 [Paraburkholderia caffeinilytica]GGC57784.1 hypothetical protein GCM10011400_51820 [Paraburkholderia caffeinilytica]CAB3804877.1 hypothetical protein LMG28690_06123 [Paraburkholderia caffeinilytica]
MANLVETSQWEEGVYQLETSDPVVGGPDGIDNRQAKQLANRTAYLKAQQEAHAGAADPHPQYQTPAETQVLITAAINALVAAAPGALDTLKELADALGDDPNFATTMMNALALKAPLASPVFTGTPKVPTQAVGDNSLAAASTAFVNALVAAGVQSAGKIYGVNRPNLLPNGSGEFGDYGWDATSFGATLDGNAGGSLFQNAAAINAATVQDGSPFIAVGPNVNLAVSGDVSMSTATSGRGFIKVAFYDSTKTSLGSNFASTAVNFGTGFSSVQGTGVTPASCAYVKVFKIADTNVVAPIGGVRFRRIKLELGTTSSLYSDESSIASLAALFSYTIGTNGYFKLPSGLIVQWGSAGSNASGIASLTLPVAFPNALLVANCNYLLNGTGLGSVAQMSSNSTKSTLYGNVFITTNGVAVSNGVVWFIAIGN